MNQDSFFYASYRYSGGDIPEAKLFTGEIINKRLSFSSDTLLLLASELYQVDSVQIRPEYADSFKLYYYRPGLKQRTLIAQFHPVFLDNNSTDQGLNLLSEIILQKQEAELEAERRKKDQWLKEQLSSYLLEIYGRTDKNQLDRWLDNFLQSKRN